MKRRIFFQKLFAGMAAVAVAPKILAEDSEPVELIHATEPAYRRGVVEGGYLVPEEFETHLKIFCGDQEINVENDSFFVTGDGAERPVGVVYFKNNG